VIRALVRTKRKGVRCACWEISVERDDAEALLTELRTRHAGLLIQVIGASHPPNPAAIEMVATQTFESARSGSTIADRPELDVLMRLAGTRQIGEALSLLGYKAAGKRLFLLAATSKSDDAIQRLGKYVDKRARAREIPAKKLTKDDLDQVERASLLSARL
jgi:tRNA threonylcarbamoyladenosine modification (KEOPS) complex Cgi121 subunit